jgi:hypothetical protein
MRTEAPETGPRQPLGMSLVRATLNTIVILYRRSHAARPPVSASQPRSLRQRLLHRERLLCLNGGGPNETAAPGPGSSG